VNANVISKEHPVSGGAEFSNHVLMSITLFDEATTLLEEATIFKEKNYS